MDTYINSFSKIAYYKRVFSFYWNDILLDDMPEKSLGIGSGTSSIPFPITFSAYT